MDGKPRSDGRRIHRGALGARFLSAILAGCVICIGPAPAADGMPGTVASGHLTLSVRYRFEHVEDDFHPGGRTLHDADANTLRTALGYTTGPWHAFRVALEMEQISRFPGSHYDEGLGRPSRYAVVADPDGTELNQGYVAFTGVPSAEVRIGRQEIAYRDAPYHRFVGNILWRQNWQTFDAATVAYTGIEDTRVDYAFVWDVNRIFGEDAPEPLDDFTGASHFATIRNSSLKGLNIEAYAYLLDFANAPRFSSLTAGARASGEFPAVGALRPFYALEFARQSDYGHYPGRYAAGYDLFEGGVRAAAAGPLQDLALTLSYERLGGNGAPHGSFVTILGTNHAFQGTADRFLITPDDGIRDYFVTAAATAFGAKLQIAWHLLRSDHLDYGYGSELDAELSRPFGKHLTGGLKFAGYNADRNALNRARNGPPSADVRKFWLYLMYRY